MPDADDFDVEYFRNLLKTNSPQEGSAPTDEPSLPAAKKTTRPTAKPTASREKSKPAAGRKKRKSF